MTYKDLQRFINTLPNDMLNKEVMHYDAATDNIQPMEMIYVMSNKQVTNQPMLLTNIDALELKDDKTIM